MSTQWLKRLWRGKEKLRVVFWGYGCVQALIFAVMSGVLSMVEKAPIKERVITPGMEREIMNAWGILIIAWMILIFINSRNTDGKVYKYLSRFFAFFVILFMLACIGSGWDA